MVISLIKSKSVFKRIFEKGFFIKGKNISIKYISGGSEKIEFGIVVSKKKIPLAVNRNLIRRRIKYLILQDSILVKNTVPLGFYLLIYSTHSVLPYKKIKDSMVSIFSMIPQDT